MASKSSEKVRERAYHLWQESGGEHGRDMDHWLQAERENSKSGPAADSGVSAKTPKVAKAAAAKKSGSAPVRTAPAKPAAPKSATPKTRATKSAT